MPKAKLTPFLWYERDAREAAAFYVSLFPDSSIDAVRTVPGDTPSGPEGSVEIVEFTLSGQPFVAITAGPLDPFNHAVSFVVDCADQAEADRCRDALLAGGGTSERCGWVRDRWGLCWQVVPAEVARMLADPDRARARRATDAMLGMDRLDVAAMRAAVDGG